MIITPAVYYYRSLLNYHGEHIGLDPRRIPGNTSVDKFAEALAKAWTEYNRPRLDLI
jgi:glutathione synthase